MKKIIGLDPDLFAQLSGNERFMYHCTIWSFVVVIVLSIVSNGYFGWMMTASWLGVVSMAFLMGFIHFSILRIAIITMISLPLVKKNDVSLEKASRWKKVLAFGSWFTFANGVRWIFVGCIAVSMAFPLVSAFHHASSQDMNRQKRMEVFQASAEKQGGQSNMSVALKRELLQANYPFYVFRQWWSNAGKRAEIGFWMIMVAFPFFFMVVIKHNKSFVYAQRASEKAIRDIQIDYAETLEESQLRLSQRFPFYTKRLQDLSPYEDAPFNSILKQTKQREWGTDVSWNQWVKAL